MNKKGITLIALVITIIILLILAGVTISTMTSENSLLQKVKEAVLNNKRAEIEEEIKLLVDNFLIDNLNSENVNLITLSKYLNKDNIQNEIINDKLQILYKGYDVTIDNNFNIVLIEKTKKFDVLLSITNGVLGNNDYYISDVKLEIIGISGDIQINEIVYRINGEEEIKTSENSIVIELIEEGEYEIEYFANSIDGQKSKPKKKTIKIDKSIPEAIINLSSFEAEINENITIDIQMNDTISGIDLNNSKYVINNTPDNIGIEDQKYTGGLIKDLSNINSNKSSILYIHLLLIDNAGNKTEIVSQRIKFLQTVYYLKGNETYNDLTGGWTYVGHQYNYNTYFYYSNSYPWAKGNYCIGTVKDSSSGAACTAMSTKNKVDLTNIDILYCDWLLYTDGNVENDYYFGVSSKPCSADTSFDEVYTRKTKTMVQMPDFETISLDVSNLKGEYYIKLLCQRTSSNYYTCYLGAKNIYGR